VSEAGLSGSGWPAR